MEMLQTRTESKDYGNTLNSPNIMELAFQNILNEIIEDVISDLCFKVHRGVRLGYYPVHEYVLKDNEFEIYKSQENGSRAYHGKGSDIFGHFKGSQTLLCCPVCQKKRCSSRFAPHLFNCMGFGRRFCGKRSTAKLPTLDMYESDHDEDENSSDCNSSSRKRKKGKNTRKKLKGKNSDSFVSSSSEANYTEMTQENIRDCLSQMCGVISERTGRFCRNTLKCSMHVDDQRREVRDLLLGSSSVDQITDDIHIDVDTVDEDSPTQLWYSNRKTSKKTVESNICTSSSNVSSNRQEDYSSSLSKFASSSYS